MKNLTPDEILEQRNELLEALKEMLYMTDGNCKNAGKCKTLSEAEKMARTAISKAIG
jgi:hypothetical protein